MNYQKIYDALIERGRNRVPQGYVERHHILPRCMGGSDENSNLVALTPEEHFVAHVLLVKMYPEQRGLIQAVQQMCASSGKHRRSKRKLYGWLKRRHSQYMSALQRGSGNSQYGTKWISNQTTHSNSKIKSSDEIPEGWCIGRNVWKRKPKEGRKPQHNSHEMVTMLHDYELGLPMKEILTKYNRRSEQSVTITLRKRFPERKKFKPNERIQVTGVIACIADSKPAGHGA